MEPATALRCILCERALGPDDPTRDEVDNGVGPFCARCDAALDEFGLTIVGIEPPPPTQ